MTRKKEFDEEDVLRRATEIFRQGGYATTSVDDLLRVTGISRSSLYASFGNKEKLFQRILDRYCAQMMDRLLLCAEAPPPVALRRFLVALVDALEGWGRPGGCLLTNTCGEAGATPPSIQRYCRASLAKQQRQLYDYFEVAKQRDELPASADPDKLAEYFVALRQAIGVLWRAGSPREQLEHVIDVSVSVLSGAASLHLSSSS
ncbi:TetR/AcrR family transcriptional regulator [Mycobacterium paraintracellulare]|uniref:TetR/AcrR family transcriptional regulator n=1 Tax=Mycobacterium paraintracellulare TaxID=1138383 RepID=UPI00191685D3|nr:TetR/AcrR family transcriptional regulator [Mycobacterium paraintracellulare]